MFEDEENPHKKALALDKKRNDVKIEIVDGRVKVQVNLKLGLRELRTDSVGEVITLRKKENTFLSDGQLKGAEKQATDAVYSAFAKSVESKCDFLGIKNSLSAKYGKDFEKKLSTSEGFWDSIDFCVTVNCQG